MNAIDHESGPLFAPAEVLVEARADGSTLLRSPMKLARPAVRVGDYLEHWARVSPDRVYLAERGPEGSRPHR